MPLSTLLFTWEGFLDCGPVVMCSTQARFGVSQLLRSGHQDLTEELLEVELVSTSHEGEPGKPNIACG